MNNSNRARAAVCLAAILMVLGVAAANAGEAPRAGAARPAQASAAPVAPVIRTVQLRKGIYVLLGAGGNITAQVGEQGVLLVNAGNTGASDAVLAALAKITDRPLRMILNTSADAHNTGGNEKLFRAGKFVDGSGEVPHAQISAHEGVMKRLSTQKPEVPSNAWPSDIFQEGDIEFWFNDESLVMIHEPAAHSDGDSIVYFRQSDVISAGDLFLQNSYPVIDVDHGGGINGVIAALNQIIDIAIPKINQEGGTLIVSGDGRASDEYEVVNYRDMITIFRDRIADLVAKGMTLEQVQAVRPTSDYDARYGTWPGWNTAQFVEAAYRSLKASGVKQQ